jgi:hypothetical protein
MVDYLVYIDYNIRMSKEEFYNLIVLAITMFVVCGFVFVHYGTYATLCSLLGLFVGIFIRRDIMK